MGTKPMRREAVWSRLYGQPGQRVLSGRAVHSSLEGARVLTIERDSPVPYYDQLFGILRARIIDGEIAADERLPSEHELCREFGLSRGTVRQTLLKLESEGYA